MIKNVVLIRLIINGQGITFFNKMVKVLVDGDEIRILPLLAGD
jgi:molybdopterin converting factor small subunit